VDQDAIDTIAQQRRRLLATLRRWLGSREEAEDILQEALTRALPRGASLRAQESAVAWFGRLLRNLAVDHLRRRGAEQRVNRLLQRDETLAPSLEAMQAAICRCIDHVIPTLEPEYERVLRRVDLEGARVATVARELATSEGNVRVRRHRARMALRARLLEVCGLCAEEGACLTCDCPPQTGAR
jgi:RNA polymerase sigma-70 factor (ECF subfamily)